MEPNKNTPQTNSEPIITQPVENPTSIPPVIQSVSLPQTSPHNLKWIIWVVVTILILSSGYFAYNTFFNKSNNQINAMDTQSNKEQYVSKLSGDEKLISESIQQLREIVIKKDSEAFLSYATTPMVLMGLDKKPNIKETLDSTKETMGNESAKKEFFELFLPIVDGLTPEVVEPQLTNCEWREKDANFPPNTERGAVCTFNYTVDPSLVGSPKDTNPIPVKDYKLVFFKVSGLWYIDVSQINAFDFMSKLDLLKTSTKQQIPIIEKVKGNSIDASSLNTSSQYPVITGTYSGDGAIGVVIVKDKTILPKSSEFSSIPNIVSYGFSDHGGIISLSEKAVNGLKSFSYDTGYCNKAPDYCTAEPLPIGTYRVGVYEYHNIYGKDSDGNSSGYEGDTIPTLIVSGTLVVKL